MTDLEVKALKPSENIISSRGELKEVVYPVWTPKGVDFLRKVLKINN